MKIYKIILASFLLFNLFLSNSFSSEIYFIDTKKILNQSKAGKGAQDILKKQLTDETKKFDKQLEDLKKEEKDLISQKKVLSSEEYKKKLNALRKKNISYQKNRQLAANEIFKKKQKARKELNKALKPIIEKYMLENNIDIVIDKKSIVVAKSEIDLTDKILKLLDKELKSINLK